MRNMNIKLAKEGDKEAIAEILESFEKFIIKQSNRTVSYTHLMVKLK